MNISRKRLTDYDWLAAVLPLVNEQKKLVNDFGTTLLAQGADEIAPEAAIQASIKALADLHSRTQRIKGQVGKMGTPTSQPAKQAHRALQEALRLWKIATSSGKEYSRILSSGIESRTFSRGILGRSSGSAMLFRGELFSETMKRAREALEYTEQLIDALERDYMATALPSEAISNIPFGKALLDGMKGINYPAGCGIRRLGATALYTAGRRPRLRR